MIAGKCPICSKRFEIASLVENPAFPFCSDRCRLIDLGRWLDEEYTVPVKDDQHAPDSEPDERPRNDAGQ